MSQTRVFKPENPLASSIQSRRGSGANELVARAETQVAEVSASIRTHVWERVEEILRMAQGSDNEQLAVDPALGSAALEIAEVAGAVGLEVVGEVARGISAMVDWAITKGAGRVDALALHLDSLKLLQQGAGRTAGEDQMLARLRALRGAIGVVE